MDREPDLTCPKCGNVMDVITAEDDGSMMRVCQVCATLAWTGKEGGTETTEAEEITGEAKRRLLENAKFTTVEEELARLRPSMKTRPRQ